MIDPELPFDDLPDHCGCPFHGRVTNGVLDTGLGITKTYPVPASGDCWKVQVPGIGDWTTSPDEAALGMEWRNYAYLTGKNAAVCGKELGIGSWLYCVEPGKVYLCTLTNIASDITLSSSFSYSISVERFGLFGTSTEEPRTLTVEVSGFGTTPELDMPGGSPGEKIITASSYVSDILPDGSAILLGLRNIEADDAMNAGGFDPSAVRDMLRRPLGFVKLSISGSSLSELSATGSVVSDRDATLGYSASVGEDYYCEITDESWYVSGGDYLYPAETFYSLQMLRTINATRRVAAYLTSGGAVEYILAEWTYSHDYFTQQGSTTTHRQTGEPSPGMEPCFPAELMWSGWIDYVTTTTRTSFLLGGQDIDDYENIVGGGGTSGTSTASATICPGGIVPYYNKVESTTPINNFAGILYACSFWNFQQGSWYVWWYSATLVGGYGTGNQDRRAAVGKFGSSPEVFNGKSLYYGSARPEAGGEILFAQPNPVNWA